MKPRKESVALVIEGPSGLLLVRRPEDDESLPGEWGLPAATLRPDETEEDAVLRAGRDKLGVEVRPLRVLGEASGERPDYRIMMRDWAVEILAGEPGVPQAGEGTQYESWRWGEPSDLVPAARHGSLCARVLLRERGIEPD
ncbi:MAG TPA: NUDIX domain-containing protein [Thermoleophilaceae bacterium]|nr:NUDIX domain-containing protein [Thermoleophilaceae bacterium]